MRETSWKDNFIDTKLYEEVEWYNEINDDNSGFYLVVCGAYLHFFNTCQLEELLKSYMRACVYTNDEPPTWNNIKIRCVDNSCCLAMFVVDYENYDTMKWEISKEWKELKTI